MRFNSNHYIAKLISSIAALALLLSLVPQTLVAASAPPTILSYQGRLTDSGGNLLGGAGTTYYFQFSLWTSPTVGSGTQVWPASTPGTTTATVRQGVFNVNIGDTTNGYPDALNINFANYPQLYLQVQVSANNVSSETLAPRQQMTSSVYAQVAGAVMGNTSQSAFGTTTPVFNAGVTVAATSSTVVPFAITGASGQTANLFQIQSNSFTNLFSVTSAGALTTAASTTIGGVFNAVGGLSTLSNLFALGSSTIAGAFSSTVSNVLASTTLAGNSLFNFATTTNLAITGTANTLLKTLTNGAVVAALAGSDYVTPSILNASFPQTTFGSSVANATSTLIGFTGGLYATASSTFTSTLAVNGALTANGGITASNITNNGVSANQIIYTNNNKQEVSVATSSLNIGGSAGSVANALTFNNAGAGAASGQTFNGSSAATISYNTLGATPTTRNINTAFPLQGGGSLAADLTLSSAFGTTTNTGLPVNQFVYTNNGGVLVTVASSSLSLPNTALQNSTLSINGASVALGGSITVSSTTLLANSNTFTGGNIFQASTTIGNGSVTGGLTISGTGTTTNLIVTSANSAGCAQFSAQGLISSTGSACGGGGGAFPFVPTTFGSTVANATTTTLIGFTQGIYSLASSTIGNGTQKGGLTISGGATTTLNAYFASKVGIGSTTYSGALSVRGIDGDTLGTDVPAFLQLYGGTGLSNGSGSAGNGASAYIVGGAGGASGASNGGAGGAIVLTGGAGGSGPSTDGAGGAVVISGGADGNNSFGGAVSLQGGNSGAAITLGGSNFSGSAGSLAITGAADPTGVSGGGAVTITGGTSGTVSGGNVTVNGGGGGVRGNVILQSNVGSGFVGIGSASAPQSLLSVFGGVGIGSYATAVAAPTNGLIVSGSTGIGSSSPFAKFAIQANNGDTATVLFAIGSSTSGATTTLISADNRGNISILGTASSTNLIVSSLGASAGQCVTASVTGQLTTTSCGGGGGGAFPFTQTTFGVTNANATSTLIGFTKGIYALASSTIGDGTQTGGLTISGTGTTTNLIVTSAASAGCAQFSALGLISSTGSSCGGAGGAFPFTPTTFGVTNANATSTLIGFTGGLYATATSTFLANLGVGTTSPFANFAIHNLASSTNTTLFAIGSTTLVRGTVFATSTLLSFSNTGQLTIGQNSAPVGSSTQLSILTGTSTIKRISQTTLNSNAGDSVYVQGRYAYIAEGGTLTNSFEIYDISNPNAPVRVGQTSKLSFDGESVVVQGHYAYIDVGGLTYLEVYDVSNPAAPVRVGTATKGAGAFGQDSMAIQGRYAYLAEASSVPLLEIFDLSSPTAPVRVSQSSLTDGCTDVGCGMGLALQGQYVYIAEGTQIGGTNAFEIFDVSNPSAPVRVAQANLANFNQPDSVAVQGSYAYIAEGGGKTNAFEIFNISNPASPVRVSQSNLSQGSSGGGGDTVTVQGRYAYIAEGSGAANAFEVFDISNPAAPVRVSQNNLANGGNGVSATGIYVQGRYAYIVEGGGITNAFEIFDLGGAYIQQGEFGGLETGTLNVHNSISALDGNFAGGLTTGGSLNVNGTASIFFASSTSLANIFSVAVSTTTSTASSTQLFSVFGNGTASTTNLIISALGTSAGQCITASATGQLNTTSCGGGGGAFPFTPTTSFGINANSTSTLILLTQGLSASSTITFGNANGTQFSFNSSTGNLGLGTSTPFAQFSMIATSTNGVNSPLTLFAIASTTAGTATTTLFSISNTGQTSHIIPNLTTGAFTIGTSTTAQPAFSISTAAGISVGGLVGIATSSPWGKLAVEMGSFHPSFVISNQGSSTSAFIVSGANQDGRVGVGTSSPFAMFSVGIGANSNTEAALAVGKFGSSTLSLYVGSANQNGFVGIGTTTNVIATSSALVVGNNFIPTGKNIAVFSNAGGAAYVSNLGFTVSSDQRLKKNISTVSNWSELAAVMQLQTVTYNLNPEADGSPVHTGFIAQQVQTVVPDLVQTNDQGFLSFNYGGLTPYLAAAIQAEQQEILAIASSTASTTQIFITNQSILFGTASTTATSSPALAVWNATASTSASVVINGSFVLNGKDVSSIASTSATMTEGAINSGEFSNASGALISAMHSALTNIAGLAQTGIREMGSAVHATAGIFNAVFAKEVHTDKLCVGDTCVTQAQFLQMVQASSAQASSSGSNAAPAAAPADQAVAPADPTPVPDAQTDDGTSTPDQSSIQ